MRLLEIHSDGRLTLTKDIVLEAQVPRYAILSHTWGSDDQEVSYSDMITNTGKNKDGYQKVRFCHRQTQRDGLRYFWIDTCCINKENSSELSEAINSMFRWYKQSSRCYVYLSDVTGESVTWQRAFHESKWFTRGWTLQELLAPLSVDFFSSDGRRLGSKQSLELLIHDATGIPTAALQGWPLDHFTIHDRMSWSCRRKTTRPEDKAYSLLGIFGVFMLPIYGEGEDHAFVRLNREVGQIVESVLERLPTASGSSFDAASEHCRTCQGNTRVELLREIHTWINDPEGKSIFWLNGMAGTGKTTIARTVAQTAAEDGYLGASFFFKRGERERSGTSRFVSTIAAQLVVMEPALAKIIKSVLDKDAKITEKLLLMQFKSLILDPLSNLAKKASTLLIVVDGLDECDQEEDVKMIIDQFFYISRFLKQSTRLRIFMTSRPDIPIRAGLSAVAGSYRDFILHNISESVIKQDLSLYFECELANIKDEYNRLVPQSRHLPSGWPGRSKLRTLVQMTAPLFIFAATICRFLADRKQGNPNKNLRRVLKYGTRSQESKLDATYRPILDMMLIGLSQRERSEVLPEFRAIVGSIVLLSEPLSASALAALLDAPQATIDDRLDMFHSVLDVPSSPIKPIRLLHLSFRDFLTDPEKRDQHDFWLDERRTHKELAARCLRLMNSTLRTGICREKWPGARISHFNLHVNQKLQAEVEYACKHWAHHFEQAGHDFHDEDEVHSFLKQHFLHWLEALVLIPNSRGTSRRVIESIQRLLPEHGCMEMSKFLVDAQSFIMVNNSLIYHAPLQLYSAALVFAPKFSAIRNTFYNELPTWLSANPSICINGDATHEPFRGLSAFSPRGNLENKLEIVSVAYSPNVEVVATGSADHTVQLLSVSSGNFHGTLRGHTGAVNSVSLSLDAKLIASGSMDKTIRLWSTHTSQLYKTLEGHTDKVNSVAFAPTSELIVSGSSDCTIRLWWVAAGALHRTLEGHLGSVNAVTFSPNGQVVASGSSDATIKLWLASSGALQHTLAGHPLDVSMLAFSPDGRIIASSSLDQPLRLWSTDKGHCVMEFHIDYCHFDMWFHPISRFLHTDVGIFDLNDVIGPRGVNTHSTSLNNRLRKSHGLGLSRDQVWITYNGKNLFHLPAIPSAAVLSDSTVVLGFINGVVIVIKLSLSELQDLTVDNSLGVWAQGET
ncbi:vegetative incompatibility protein HET-E-1 [Nemania abortiva]|nr:vegetative incompatibility protein HET-E-1 [Nemania abortiva]